jgi:hypothetical protein
VKARVKAEHLLKSTAVVQPYPQPYMMDPAAAYNAYRSYPQQYAPRVPYGQPQQPYWEGQAAGGDASKAGGDARRGGYRGRRDRGATSPHGGGQVPPTSSHGGGRPRGNSQGQGQAPFKGVDPNAAIAVAGGPKGRRKGKKSTETKPVVSNGVHFNNPSGISRSFSPFFASE